MRDDSVASVKLPRLVRLTLSTHVHPGQGERAFILARMNMATACCLEGYGFWGPLTNPWLVYRACTVYAQKAQAVLHCRAS